jgi:carotenoid cleavage dioxygenase
MLGVNANVTTREQWFEGLAEPLKEEVTCYDLPVIGDLPKELSGRFLRIGPNPISGLTEEFRHYFLGEGMVHGVRITDGKAKWYRARWVRGGKVAKHFGESELPGPNFERSFSANTHVTAFNGETLALTEGGVPPVVLDYELNSLRRTDFDGGLPGALSGHPKIDPITGELHAVCYWYPDKADCVQYVVIDRDGKVIRADDVPVNNMPNIHDMALTEKYAVVLDFAVEIDIDVAMTGHPLAFFFNESHGSRLGFIERGASVDDIIWIDIKPCYAFHVVNSYDSNNGEVVIDVCRYDRLFEPGCTGPDNLSTYYRWTVNPALGTIHEVEIDPRPQDFPRVAPEYVSLRNRYAYCASLDKGWAFGRYTYKHDLNLGTSVIHDHGVGRTGSEPVPISRKENDEGGEYVFMYVHDAESNKSELVLIDGRNFEKEPLARILLPNRVPSGFHGDWIPDSMVSPD